MKNPMALTEIRQVSCVPRTKAKLESSLKARAVADMRTFDFISGWSVGHITLTMPKGPPYHEQFADMRD
jgi:hypothetical protein